MTHEEVPDELVRSMAAAEYDAPPGCSIADSYRAVLAAVLPQHERQVRAKIANQVRRCLPILGRSALDQLADRIERGEAS